MINDEVTDPDSFEFAPGRALARRGQPERDGAVLVAEPDQRRDRDAAHGRLEQTMQNLAGGYPFTTTSEGGVDASTATQAALVTNIAQQASVRLKEQLAYAYERIGQQRTELNQQFLRVPIMVEQIGLDSASELVEIAPYLLQGEYLFDISPMVESLMRSERRAEGNSMLQMFLNSAQVWIALAQAGLATPPNATSSSGSGSTPTRSATPTGSSAPPAAAAAAGRRAGAITGRAGTGAGRPAARRHRSAGDRRDTSPSAQASLSAATHMQRLGAMSGGAANA
jgi:hypothetical protein